MICKRSLNARTRCLTFNCCHFCWQSKSSCFSVHHSAQALFAFFCCFLQRRWFRTANSWTCRNQTSKLFINRFCNHVSTKFWFFMSHWDSLSLAQHNEFDNLFGSKTCPVQWFSNFRVIANSTLHKLHQQKLTICSDLQQHLHDHNGYLRVDVGCQSMVNDQVRARQRILEIQCFCSKQGFLCARVFVQWRLLPTAFFSTKVKFQTCKRCTRQETQCSFAGTQLNSRSDILSQGSQITTVGVCDGCLKSRRQTTTLWRS